MLNLKKSLATLLSSTIIATNPAFADSQIFFRYNPNVVEVQALVVESPNVPDLYIGEAFSAHARASGGVGNMTWSYTGKLPAGVTFGSDGVLSGTPSVVGAFNGITLIATDDVGTKSTYPISLPVYGQLAGGDLHDVLGLDDNQSLAIPASGGKAPLTFSLADGSLPVGMSISGSSLSGTPTLANVYEGTIRVSDANGRTANVDVNLSVFSILNATATFGDAYVGEAYSGRFRATGGSKVYTWTADNLPDNLSLDQSSGAVTGSVTEAGSNSVTGTVADGYEFKSVSATINAFDLPEIADKSFADPYSGSSYSTFSPVVAGGKSPLTYTASGLPAGLGINSATGAITGTPTAAGSSSATITVADANGKSDAGTYSFETRAVLSLAAKAYADPYVGTSYSATNGAAPVASGGKTPYIWSASSLPAGLNIAPSTGVISGTPSSIDPKTATITVADANSKSVSRTYAFAPRGALTLSDKTYADPYVGTGYAAADGAAPTASGGKAPYTWSATGLPAGMGINASTGLISGTPTSASAVTASITIRDANNLSISKSYSFTPRAALALATKSYPNPYVGTAYSASEGAAPTVTGGKAPYKWAATGLPAGMVINATTGVVSGTPTATIATTATITVTDANNKPVSRTYAFAPRAALVLSAKTYANPYVGTAYSASEGAAPTASGGLAPYTWIATSLPAGLSMNPSTGVISGTPTSATASTATITITDANSKSVSRTYAFAPRGALALATKTYADPYVGTAYSASEGAAPTASGGLAPYTWSASGLPAGLKMSTTGIISGTPTSTSAATATVTVKDANNKSISRSYAFAPRAALTIANNMTTPVKMTAAVNAAMKAAGGKAPYVYSASGLPSGLSINASTGAVTGTPKQTGNFSTVITVKDANNKTKSATKSIVSEAGVITVSMAGGNGAITLKSLFSSTDWASATPKVVNLASGQIRGSTSATNVVSMGGSWGGTLTFNVAGEIQGKSGAAGTSSAGGAGGNALNVDYKSTTGAKLLLNVTGAIRGGGGGGGKGGKGGTGGGGSTTSNATATGAYSEKSYALFQPMMGPSPALSFTNITILWKGTKVFEQRVPGLLSASTTSASKAKFIGTDGATYTIVSVVNETSAPKNVYGNITRAGTTTTNTNGGAGGNGGNGGRGQGYTVAKANGSGGANGVAGGTSAGAGGKGATGGNGGAWGANGTAGGKGATGANGNRTNGAAGASGGALGAAGKAIVGNANVTRSGSGTISGPTS